MKKTIYSAEFSALAPIRVDEITIEHLPESDPDLSHLGEYSNTPGPADRTIDREARGDSGRNEFRYFIAAMSGVDAGNPESVEQDYKRMEAYNQSDWYMLGARASAVVSYPTSGGSRRLETMTSGGLWGIESDSDAAYITRVERDELLDLANHLAQFGVAMPELEPVNA